MPPFLDMSVPGHLHKARNIERREAALEALLDGTDRNWFIDGFVGVAEK